MFTAPNPGPKTLEGTHTYVVGDAAAYVIDPGPDVPEYLSALAGWIDSNACSVRGILLTHGHPDHAPGATALSRRLNTPVWSSPDLDRSYGGNPDKTEPIFGGQVFPTDGDELRAIFTPGHSHDHVAFWIEKARILFTGDSILGRGTSLIAPPEGDMALYLRSLQAMRNLDPLLIAPGHGPIVRDPLTRIDQYIEHRLERERQVVTALEGQPRSIPELVSLLYQDVDPRLHELAAGSMAAHLAKLETESRVTREDGVYRLDQ